MAEERPGETEKICLGGMLRLSAKNGGWLGFGLGGTLPDKNDKKNNNEWHQILEKYQAQLA